MRQIDSNILSSVRGLCSRLAIVVAASMTTACNDFSDINIPEQQMTIRQTIFQYYLNRNFWVGASVAYGDLIGTDRVLLKDKLMEEFPLAVSSNDFEQRITFPTATGEWQAGNYLFMIDNARKENQIVLSKAALSDNPSLWVKSDERTADELQQIIDKYVTHISTDLQGNKDIVKWVDVVSNTVSAGHTGYNLDGTGDGNTIFAIGDWSGPGKGSDSDEMPWTITGMEQVDVLGQSMEIPKYIIDAFRISHQSAPDVKKLIAQSCDDFKPEMWEKVKTLILAIRSKGLRVDGVDWQARVSLGWERRGANMMNLELFIDWCYLNNVEFHISDIEVVVDKGTFDNTIVREATRTEQSATIGAIASTMANNAGKAAISIGFYPNDRFVDGVGTCASLYDFNPTAKSCTAQPSCEQLKQILFNKK